MYYRIRHLTRFEYSAPVSESHMEIRMHPRTESQQRSLDFQLLVTPKAQVHSYRDYLGNSIDHFSVPAAHRQLQIHAESVVEVKDFTPLPYFLSPEAWADLDYIIETEDYWPELLDSPFCRKTDELEKLMREIGAVRRDDPLALLRELNSRLCHAIDYTPEVTTVDSPIDESLSLRKGVCQDFSHIMISMLRALRIPARYVSGYLYHGKDDHDRSGTGATHAWVEAYLPTLGWIGLDPTNDLLAGPRHIRTAIGRDYTDVPPTRGVLKGDAKSRLTVAVAVSASEDLPPDLTDLVQERDEELEREVAIAEAAVLQMEQQQQQQQQQQN